MLVDRAGKIVGTYDKVHLVMFGEYIPFSKWLPFLKRISSLTGAAEAGAGPVALCVDGVCYAPNICYETVIPHVIRHQVATLDAAGERPDVLVNLTNDAWYWGSSELDMHLACDVFRAVETRDAAGDRGQRRHLGLDRPLTAASAPKARGSSRT